MHISFILVFVFPVMLHCPQKVNSIFSGVCFFYQNSSVVKRLFPLKSQFVNYFPKSPPIKPIRSLINGSWSFCRLDVFYKLYETHLSFVTRHSCQSSPSSKVVGFLLCCLRSVMKGWPSTKFHSCSFQMHCTDLQEIPTASATLSCTFCNKIKYAIKIVFLHPYK